MNNTTAGAGIGSACQMVLPARREHSAGNLYTAKRERLARSRRRILRHWRRCVLRRRQADDGHLRHGRLVPDVQSLTVVVALPVVVRVKWMMKRPVIRFGRARGHRQRGGQQEEQDQVPHSLSIHLWFCVTAGEQIQTGEETAKRPTVTDTKILRAIPLLDNAALEAVGQWQFSPSVRVTKRVARGV
jgi:hypothetical protein